MAMQFNHETEVLKKYKKQKQNKTKKINKNN